MKELAKNILILLLVLLGSQYSFAQEGSLVHGNVFSKTDGPLPGVGVVEVDASNRFVSSTTTDVQGNFSLKIKNTANKLRFNYVGYPQKFVPIGNTKQFKVEMEESTKSLGNVVIKASKKKNTGAFDLSQKEISGAVQSLSSEEFKGLSVASVDDALQGKISGLDVVSNSGDLGSGATMRIRGLTSINGNSEPLIVVNGIPFNSSSIANFDFSTANQEQFAQLLSVNVDDIEKIEVLKDAATTAIYGAKGASGVIKIDTKRGARGKTKVTYTYRYSGAWQPKGMKMMNGDDYTMLMKEAYFNPSQNDGASNVREFNYDPTFSEYQQYNNNTDWVKAVSQYGETHDHSVQIDGGGEKARFNVSAGYYNQTGTVIAQQFDRYTARSALDYFVSERIKFSSDFNFTYYNNHQNNTNGDGLLSIAYKKMPNLAIYKQDTYGNDTQEFYNVLPTASDMLDDQKKMINPVQNASLAYTNSKSTNVHPVFTLKYHFLDPTNTQLSRLFYQGTVSFEATTSSSNSYYSKELAVSSTSSYYYNRLSNYESRGMYIWSQNSLTFMPKFANQSHSLFLWLNSEFSTYTSRYQSNSSYNAPAGIKSSSVGIIDDVSTGSGQGRNLKFNFASHYSFKEKYLADFSLTRYGSSRFGEDRRWGYFPGVSLGWNIADEKFIKSFKDSLISTLKLRLSWGITGTEPPAEFLYLSTYSVYGSYLGLNAVKPNNIPITGLRWEKTTQYNLGVDLGIKDEAYYMAFDVYYKRTTDLIFNNRALPSTSGFESLSYSNVGTMENIGWELNLNSDKIFKVGDFSFGMTLNFSNYVNRIVYLDEDVINSINKEWNQSNGSYLTRIQVKNAYGSIYGFKYKGVYSFTNYVDESKGTSPYAHDEQGKLIRDGNGNPVRMVFNYDPVSNSNPYQFKGGDAIYEDINHDGNINQLDIVYLGNSNPLFNGGITFKVRYKGFTFNMFSNFRVGGKIVNYARMNLENMYTNNNQCTSVNWRWRKEGDVTSIPRALKGTGYNWLGSDRYVEDGSFFRAKYFQLNYNIPPKMLKTLRLSDMVLYFTMNNLFVLTKYSGVDPEVGLGQFSVSGDSNQTPRSRSFTAGISVKF